MLRKAVSAQCNDEMLVVYHDGELNRNQSAATRRHLAVCRRCRERQAAIRSVVLSIRRLRANPSLADLVLSEKAKQRFLEWRESFEMLHLIGSDESIPLIGVPNH
jgi:anti-sigma factor RsiW